jgi:hypothetical protein
LLGLWTAAADRTFDDLSAAAHASKPAAEAKTASTKKARQRRR